MQLSWRSIGERKRAEIGLQCNDKALSWRSSAYDEHLRRSPLLSMARHGHRVCLGPLVERHCNSHPEATMLTSAAALPYQYRGGDGARRGNARYSISSRKRIGEHHICGAIFSICSRASIDRRRQCQLRSSDDHPPGRDTRGKALEPRVSITDSPKLQCML